MSESKPIVYALGKPAQRAVLALVRERAQLQQQVSEVNEALADLAATYGAGFDAPAERFDFLLQNGQVSLVAYPATASAETSDAAAAEAVCTTVPAGSCPGAESRSDTAASA